MTTTESEVQARTRQRALIDFGQAPENRPRSVLVVDDDDFVRGSLAKQLAFLGVARVVTAGDGDLACQALRVQGPFDVMISDLQMPGTDGIELLRRIHDIQPGLSVLLISSMDGKVLGAAEELAGARGLRLLGCLPKPVQLSALRRTLERLDHGLTQPAAHAPQRSQVTSQELRDAIAAEQIDIYVQPQVDARTRELMGVEALARWPHAARGFIPPDQFIALAEQSGQMDALTDLVCRRAMGACSRWRQQGLDTRIAINVSVKSLLQLDLPEKLTQMSAALGLKPGQVLVEITESASVEDLSSSLDVLTRLRMRRVELSIDDFGTGYSSLAQLRRMPFTELKIDRSFVAAAVRETGARRIVESSVKLAHGLDMKVVAEGVETRADFDMMRQLGCDLIQGYYIARPMPKDELVRWAATSLSA